MVARLGLVPRYALLTKKKGYFVHYTVLHTQLTDSPKREQSKYLDNSWLSGVFPAFHICDLGPNPALDFTKELRLITASFQKKSRSILSRTKADLDVHMV